MMIRSIQSQRGNAFMMVLIGVVLFGALAFTFVRSGKQGIGNVSSKENTLDAQSLVGFFNQVDKAYQVLRTRNKCSVDDISFANSGDSNGFETENDSATAPGDKSCHIFDPNGGKVTFNMDWTKYQIAQSEMVDPNQYGNAYFKFSTGSNVGVGTAANDIMLSLNYVKVSVCFAYNKLLGLDIDTSVADGGPISGDENTDYVGKMSYCRYTDGKDYGQIRYVWLAR